MHSIAQTLVYAALAPLLPTERTPIDDTVLLEELELDPLDLALLAIKLEELEPENGAFPLNALTRAKSVGDLVEIVDDWSHTDLCPSTIPSPS
jgi:hypothetical protein